MKFRRSKFLAGIGLLCALPFANLSAGTMPNIAFPTMGGQEFWTDYAIRDGARVQCHAITDHCRLLDDDDLRRAWGARDEVMAELNAGYPTSLALAADRPVVVLVHGLFGHDGSFRSLKKALKADGTKVFEFSYASALLPFDAQAAALRDYVASLGPVNGIVFVTHSMGGLVVEQMLASETEREDRPTITGIVNLGAPLTGSSLARQVVTLAEPISLNGTPLGEVARGQAQAIEGHIPRCNIVGSLNNGEGVNPFVPGDDDGVVAVSEASRDDENKPVIVHAWHSMITGDETAISTVLHFVKAGSCTPDNAAEHRFGPRG
ncbi:MAG: hypothetical protein Q7T44_14960 [Parvibaculum sp.]|nr:hypothetical protein [Parvibaculum sp.]